MQAINFKDKSHSTIRFQQKKDRKTFCLRDYVEHAKKANIYLNLTIRGVSQPKYCQQN